MSSWDDDVFDQHPVWGKVDQLASLLDDERLPKALDAPQRLSIVRLKTALELLREHQSKGLKVFYTKSMLDNVDAQLAGPIIQSLSNFVGNPDNYGNSVNDAADQSEVIFHYVAQWPSLPAGGQASAAGRAFAEYRREAELALESLAEQNTELKNQLETLRTDMATVETKMTGVEDNYTVSLQERESEYLDAINRVEESGRAAYDKAIEDTLGERIDKLKALERKAKQHVERALDAQQEAEDLAAASKNSADWLSKRAFAKDFGEQARRKSAAGWAYDVLGAAVIGVPLVFVLIHFLTTSEGSGGTIAVSMTRGSIILGAVILGGYLFSRGATNHRQARASKSAEVRLNTFEAFITKLTPDEQAEIRVGMAKTIYLEGRLSSEEPESPNPFVRLLDRVSGKDDEHAEDKPA
ncbi:hypothetical protein [Mycobacterium sp. IS-1264]|uniref:hypothetical protein n=1 Tax=Mycobacterium sp. IS-1264 TaxID=1834158 RepID=UPI00096DA7AF|nr:hypothetical protein [Mycobacterium sp. IS-1264]OMC39213.1 hypothetical protein A5744_22855 [Mycobacterium sp. IS-1264]